MTPSDLYYLLQSQGLDLTESAESLAAAINAATVTTKTGARLTTTSLLDQLEPDEYAALRTTLDQLAASNPFAAGVREALAGGGVAISDERSIGFVDQFVRPVLDSLGAGAVADKVIGLGVRVTPVVTEPVTASDVEAAKLWQSNTQLLADRYNAAQSVIDAGGSTAEMLAALTGESE